MQITPRWDISIEVADKLARFFGLTLDELVHLEDASPKEIWIEDKTVNVKVQLIAQLEEEDKLAFYRIIDSMITRTKFQDFFQKKPAPCPIKNPQTGA